MKDESFGLWSKTAQSGLEYYGGQCKLDGKEYWLTLFKKNKETDKQPDYSLLIKPKEVKEEVKSDPFEEFAKTIKDDEIELDDESLPF